MEEAFPSGEGMDVSTWTGSVAHLDDDDGYLSPRTDSGYRDSRNAGRGRLRGRPNRREDR